VRPGGTSRSGAGRGRGGRRRGAVALEYALTLPFLALIILGIIECGQLMSAQELMANAGREGGRLAVLGGSTIGSNSSTGANEVNYRIRTYLDGSSIPSSAAQIAVTDLDNSGMTDLPQSASGDRIRVSITVPFKLISWSPSFFFGGVTLKSTSIMRKESP